LVLGDGEGCKGRTRSNRGEVWSVERAVRIEVRMAAALSNKDLGRGQTSDSCGLWWCASDRQRMTLYGASAAQTADADVEAGEVEQ
jgi:hypothetical protein